MTRKSLILDFIKQFRDLNSTECFNYGMCYWFAFILVHRFGGVIVYQPIDNHFAANIDGTFYDINGIIFDTTNWGPWPTEDIALNMRIERDCIRKERL